MAEVVKKPVSQLNFPINIRYHREHAWVRDEGEVLRVGISDYAQNQLGDVIFVELPRIGDRFRQGDSFGLVESAKSVSTLYMPVSGEVIGINPELENTPELINQQPYGKGWMLLIRRAEQVDSLSRLLSNEEYRRTLEG